MNLRIGHGYDIHRTVPGRKLVLGGVTFAADFGLDGHSDADALTHAICDALLGVAALPERGWAPANVDATVIAEKPKIAPRLAEMKAALAKSTGLPLDAVGLKATTNEGSDDIGRGL